MAVSVRSAPIAILYDPIVIEELNMTDESVQNPPTPAAVQGSGTAIETHPPSGWWKPGMPGPLVGDAKTVFDVLEARLTELEGVVHAIAPYSRNAEHGFVVKWLEKVGARIKSAVKL